MTPPRAHKPRPAVGLADLRVQAGLTQEELAERASMSARALRDLESGRSRPRPPTMRLLAEALNLDITAVAARFGFGPSSRPAGGARQAPPLVDALVGRDELVARVAADAVGAVARSARVLNLTGRPGVGKTCVAAAVTALIAEHFDGGAVWIAMAGSSPRARTPAEVLEDLLLEAGVGSAAVPESLADRVVMLRAEYARRRVFVVLDDVADEEQVADVLAASPAAAVLTSRRPLASLVQVRPIEVETLSSAESTVLLANLIGTGRADEEPVALAEIVRACGGLPLALRIAGARLLARPSVSLASLAVAVTDERRRLRELKYRNLEVAAPLRLALEALPAEDRQAFGLLGRLELRNIDEMTVHVCLGLEESARRAVLDRLVDARLLDAASPPHSAQVWYGFHDLVRLFARETSVDLSAWRSALGRVGHRLVTLAATADAALPGTSDALLAADTGSYEASVAELASVRDSPAAWFARMEASIDGLVHQLAADGFTPLAWQLAACVRTYGILNDRPDLWRSTHEVALAACERDGDGAGAASMLFGLGKLRHEAHQLAGTEPEELRQAAEAFEALGEMPALSRTLGELASWYGWTGEAELAERFGRRSLLLACQCPSPEIMLDALFVLGRLRVRTQRWQQAQRLLDRARELAGQLNKPRTSAQVLWQLGAVRRAQGALRDADALLGDALAAIRAVADPRGEARILIEIGDLRAQAGDPGAAIDALEASLKISREVRAWNFQALALESLSRIAEGADRLDSARDLLTAASDLWHELGDETRADVAAHHLTEISSSDQ